MAAGTITIAEAIRYVRLRLDELAAQDSDMLVAEIDDRNLGNSVALMIRDSVEFIHRTSPIELVAPVAAEYTEEDAGDIAYSVTGGVLDIAVDAASDINVLRFASLKVGDSDYVVTSLVPEGSTIARMQLNPYVRGASDSPVAVLMADRPDAKPHIRYYSTEMSGEDVSFSLRVIPVPEVDEETQSVTTAVDLKLAVLEHLTAEIMSVYGFQQAQNHYQLAGIYSQNSVAGPAVNTP